MNPGTYNPAKPYPGSSVGFSIGRFRGRRASLATTRAAFTLVEMMVVILIIGILAGLISAAAFQGLKAARKAVVVTEVDGLATSLTTYKTDYGAFPPNCGQAGADRTGRVMAHMRRRFARYNPIQGSDSGYSDMRDRIAGQGAYSGIQGYNYYDSTGTLQPLDFNTLDQAEALVYWLGGPPTPYDSSGNRLGSTKLFGFSADVTDPFKALGSRLQKVFAFDEKRLVDIDGDGWLEYIPDLRVDTTFAAPYVYFDFGTYASGATFYAYPYSSSSPPLSFGPVGMIAEWGVAQPYWESSTSYANPQSFQIVCAGPDSIYGLPGDSSAIAKLHPVGTNYQSGDADNITNLFNGFMGDAAP